jgi:hypothetical protein
MVFKADFVMVDDPKGLKLLVGSKCMKLHITAKQSDYTLTHMERL